MSSHRANNLNEIVRNENQDRSVDVYVGVFFEGTGNHRGQAEIGEAKRNNEPYEGTALPVTSSNSVSNVAMLEYLYDTKREKHVTAIYLEGIGVFENGLIEPEGLAMGTGPEGIRMKVLKAIIKIGGELSKIKLDPNSQIKLHFDIFGFSRGAAAARYFIDQVTGEKKKMIERMVPAGCKLSSIHVSYVGLYDTVSSHGISFSNDVKTLKLDAIKEAKRVFHICAADEFRSFYALTNVDSAPNKTEIFLPGSHADIGGGYLEGEDKVDVEIEERGANPDILEMGTYEACFKRYGWIRDKPDKNYTVKTFISPPLKKTHLKFRNKINKGYPNITYELMKEDACGTRSTIFNDIIEEQKTPKALESIKIRALACISIPLCRMIFSADYPMLTKEWVHFSVGSFHNKPRIKNNLYKRKIFNG